MFPQISNRSKIVAGIVAALILVGVGFGYWAFSPAPPVQQTYAPAVVQSDGSIVAEKKPDPDAKPAAMTPPGSKHTRTISVTARVKLPTIDIGGSVTIQDKVEQVVRMAEKSAPPEMLDQAKAELVAACAQQECPPVTVNIDLVTEKDGQQRAVVSSPNGKILAALDVPRENAATPPTPKLWAVGALYNPVRQTAGVAVERDIGPFRIGADLMQRGMGRFPTEPTIRALWRF
jgi:hypothetical protein